MHDPVSAVGEWNNPTGARVPDHLSATAPFPTLTAIAEASATLRIGPYVLNAGFYKPALLARDVAALELLSDGRLELGLGARQADIVGLTGGQGRAGESDPLAARVAFVRDAAGDRFADLELNLMISAAPSDSSAKPDLSFPRRHAPDLPEGEVLAFPGVMSGSPRDIADTLRDYRDRCGITYITVLAPFADYVAKAIAELR